MIKKSSILVLSSFLSIVCLCSKKDSARPDSFIFGNDTFTIAQIRNLDPLYESDSIKMQNILIRKVLASEINSAFQDSLLDILSSQLSLQSSVEWSNAASSLLLKSTKAIIQKIDSGMKPSTLIALTDSLVFEKFGKRMTERLNIVLDTNTEISEQTLELIRKLTGVSEYVAQTIFNFVNEPDRPVSDTNIIRKMVKDLLLEKKTEKKASKQDEQNENKKSPKQDNSLLALEYRSQESIQDSITRHIPDLQIMYKQFLKKDVNMSGKVMVTFRVNAAGKVIDTHVSQSEIKNPGFLKKLTSHVKVIQFNPIPENVGNMTFEFPFEFNAEM